MGILDWLRPRKPVALRIRGIGEPTLYFETSDATEIRELRRVLAVDAGSGAICMCAGTLTVEIGDEPPLTLHHGESLRWSGSHGNQPLRDPDAAMSWLSAHGIAFVREEYEDARRREAAAQEESAEWVAAMPASLRPFFDAMRSSGSDEHPDWTAAIEAEVADPIARARVLLELYGSSPGTWSPHPSYESVPATLLMRLPLATLIAAIGDAPSERVSTGAARLFSSWSFGKERRRDRSLIPAELTRALIAAIERTGNAERLDTTRRALDR